MVCFFASGCFNFFWKVEDAYAMSDVVVQFVFSAKLSSTAAAYMNRLYSQVPTTTREWKTWHQNKIHTYINEFITRNTVNQSSNQRRGRLM